MDLQTINLVEAEILRFQGRLNDVKKELKQENPPYKSQARAALKRSSVDLKNVLSKLNGR